MNIDFKNLGIGAAAGAAATGLGVAAPKRTKWAKEKAKGGKLNRDLKRKKKEQESNHETPEEK